jgi:hypothetical protein
MQRMSGLDFIRHTQRAKSLLFGIERSLDRLEGNLKRHENSSKAVAPEEPDTEKTQDLTR